MRDLVLTRSRPENTMCQYQTRAAVWGKVMGNLVECPGRWKWVDYLIEDQDGGVVRLQGACPAELRQPARRAHHDQRLVQLHCLCLHSTWSCRIVSCCILL